MIFDHDSYRTYLKSILWERSQTNPSYSLRAMAKQFGISPSQLSEAMSGRSNFSSGSLRKIAAKLNLNPHETEYLCVIGELEVEKDLEARAQLLARLEKVAPPDRPVRDLTVDYFKQISDWYHSVILELVYLPNFKFTPENVAKRLGISKLEAELAIERLERLELITQTPQGKYERPVRDLQIKLPELNAAMRLFYRQMMEKASVALETQKPGERWSGFETLPISPEAMPELSKIFERFFEDVIRVARKYPKKTEVYHLLFHFFNVSRNDKEKLK